MITIRSFAGIGDLLFLTPTLRVVREDYPALRIRVNTSHRELLLGNPFVESVGMERRGTPLLYPDPHRGVAPTQHHILSDWEIVCRTYRLATRPPELRPEIYFEVPRERSHTILVQTHHKRQWGGKKVWPWFEKLSREEGFSALTWRKNEVEFARAIARARAVVCSEGGWSHIARAVGTPAVVVYGGWSRAGWNGYVDHVNITRDVSCGPCYNREPCRHDMACMRSITIEEVKSAVERACGA